MIPKRQHAVNRTVEGEAFNRLVAQIVTLNRHLTAAAEAITRPAGQSLARWLVLAECHPEPVTVAEIARRLHLARQSVQRVADVLDADGLCSYQNNPSHRRAKLLALTSDGRHTLTQIENEQAAWANALGARIGWATLQRASEALAEVLDAAESRPS